MKLNIKITLITSKNILTRQQIDFNHKIFPKFMPLLINMIDVTMVGSECNKF